MGNFTSKVRSAMSPRLTPVQLVAFSLPVIVFQGIEIAWRTYLPAFLAQTVGLSLATIGGLLLLARVFDAAAAPVIGWASDRMSGKFGARRTWLLLGAPLVSVGALGLFRAPPGSPISIILLWALTLHFGYALMVTPHGGWGLEIGIDAQERTRVQGTKIWFAALGGGLILLTLATAERRYAASPADQMGLLAKIIAVLAPLATLLLTWVVREPTRRMVAAGVFPLRQLSGIMRDPSAGTVLLLYTLTGLAEGASGSALIFFIVDGLALRGWGSSLAFVQYPMMLIVVPLWLRWSDRRGWRQVFMTVYAWQMMVAIVGFAVPMAMPAAAAAFLILRYATGSTEFILLRAITADGVARDAEAGRRTAASSYALFNVVLVGAMGVGGAGVMASLSACGYGNGVVLPQQQFAIRLAYLLPTILAGFIGFMLLLGGRGRNLIRYPSSALKCRSR
ncbi:MFS transporter [Sphingomonas sp. PB2P19]|uniref:MFS transporter n=1 Tax=Sphingomonas rhamnosi TaxID=3096156 RepID=UPI002FC68CA9